CERYRRGHDDRAAQVAEEQPLQQENEGDARDHVAQHSAGRDVDQIGTIVDALNAYAWREQAGGVDFIDFGLDPPNGGNALGAAAHQHDALNDVVVVIKAGNPEPRQMINAHLGNVRHVHRNAAGAGDHRAADIIDRMNQSDPAHHQRLSTDIDRLTADIDVGIGQRLQYLWDRQPVVQQPPLVDDYFVSLGLAAPAGDVNHSRHGFESPLQDPVLDRFQVGHGITRRSCAAIAEDLADGAGW